MGLVIRLTWLPTITLPRFGTLTLVGFRQWWAYDYGAGNAKAIVEVTIQARNDSSYNQAPEVFALQWSDDNSNWTTAASFATTWSSPGQIQTFDVATPHSPQALAYLARTVGGNEGGNGANIATLIDGLVADGVWTKLDALICAGAAERDQMRG